MKKILREIFWGKRGCKDVDLRDYWQSVDKKNFSTRISEDVFSLENLASLNKVFYGHGKNFARDWISRIRSHEDRSSLFRSIPWNFSRDFSFFSTKLQQFKVSSQIILISNSSEIWKYLSCIDTMNVWSQIVEFNAREI